MLPFFVWGMMMFVKLIDTFLKVRGGSLRVMKALPNDQVVEFWARPLGGKIVIKSSNPSGITDKTTLVVNLTKGWVWRRGMTPFIKLDKNNNQIAWERNKIEGEIPKEVVDEIADTSFAAGMMIGIKGNKDIKRIVLLMTIIALVSVLGIVLNYYFWSHAKIITQVVQVVNSTVV
jgi:hypothetical protein